MRKQAVLIALLAAALVPGGCAKKNTEDTAAALTQGNTLLTQGEYESAATAFNQAIAGKADLEAAYRGLGIARLAMGEYEDAITAFDAALANAGADAQTMEYDISYYKASALVRLDRLNDALDVAGGEDVHWPGRGLCPHGQSGHGPGGF